ncbi:MAG: hypothetical protein HZA24_03380 [Nitrospirae bacterium]|nr:hypothetical protein [Nitrospirota bacterium]
MGGQHKGGATLTQLFGVGVTTMVIAALLPPLLAGEPEADGISRAHYQTRDIANAVVSFYQDLGRWPTMDAQGGERLTALVSGIGDARHLLMGIFGGDSPADVDLLDNHLARNQPSGNGHYATDGPRAWHGPYLPETGLDPWGHPYVVYMAALGAERAPGADKAVVLSPGPNGIVETPARLGIAARFGGDDVGMAFYVRDTDPRETAFLEEVVAAAT